MFLLCSVLFLTLCPSNCLFQGYSLIFGFPPTIIAFYWKSRPKLFNLCRRVALWFTTPKSRDKSTGQLACPFRTPRNRDKSTGQHTCPFTSFACCTLLALLTNSAALMHILVLSHICRNVSVSISGCSEPQCVD